MPELKPLLFTHTLGNDALSSAIARLRSPEPRAEEDEVLAYLSAGIYLAMAMTVVVDPLKTPPETIGEASLLTDGTWVWDEPLVYFVRTYHLELPPAFMEHGRSNAWTCPDPPLDGLSIEGQIRLR